MPTNIKLKHVLLLVLLLLLILFETDIKVLNFCPSKPVPTFYSLIWSKSSSKCCSSPIDHWRLVIKGSMFFLCGNFAAVLALLELKLGSMSVVGCSNGTTEKNSFTYLESCWVLVNVPNPLQASGLLYKHYWSDLYAFKVKKVNRLFQSPTPIIQWPILKAFRVVF